MKQIVVKGMAKGEIRAMARTKRAERARAMLLGLTMSLMTSLEREGCVSRARNLLWVR